MTIITIAIFAFALFGLVGLFVLKHRELTTGRVYFPEVRHVLDMRAQRLRARGMHLTNLVEHTPAFGVLFLRWVVHVAAVLVALAARAAERQAHAVADFVSYRRHFERRETRSEFLKEVTNHKNGLDKNS